MNLVTAYSVKIKESNKAFNDTAKKYRDSVAFFLDVALKEWDNIASIDMKSGKERQNYMEVVTVVSKNRPTVKYDFGKDFHKFPSYLRRAAIAEALGMASSYKSNLANWEAAPPETRGQAPKPPKVGYTYPAMYRDNCFVRTGTYTASLKVWIRNTWDWINVDFRKKDVDYIQRHCSTRTECVPTLRRRGKNWFLDFAFKSKQTLTDIPLKNQVVLSVDLGLNSACTCSAIKSDGTVLRRYFFKLPREEDCLKHLLGKISRANRGGMKPKWTNAEWKAIQETKHTPLEIRNVGGGSKHTPRLWALAKNMNRHIAEETARAIVDFAADCHADVIVFEYLDLRGKKNGGCKQRLHLWKARDVQKIVEGKAHAIGMRISRVCARNTSKLAFDGSGEVERGIDGNYSICKFKTGKIYNCDLSASYNIGARYFIRETLREMPATARLGIKAKIPQCAKKSTATLSTLISLCAEISSLAG